MKSVEIRPKEILIVDDHPAVRKGLRGAIESAGYICSGEAESKVGAIAQLAVATPDLLLLDLNLPDGSGIDLIKWVRKHSPNLAIVVLTMSDSREDLLAVMRSGASAYLSKGAPLEEVTATVTLALRAPHTFTSKALPHLDGSLQLSFALTAREFSVLKALAQEGSNKDISGRLFISEATLKTHIAAIYRKMEVGNRFSAVTKARAANLL